jgi:hypothetical protein
MVVIEDPLFRSPCARRAGCHARHPIAWSMVHARSRHRPLSALCANDFLAPTSATDSTSSGARDDNRPAPLSHSPLGRVPVDEPPADDSRGMTHFLRSESRRSIPGTNSPSGPATLDLNAGRSRTDVLLNRLGTGTLTSVTKERKIPCSLSLSRNRACETTALSSASVIRAFDVCEHLHAS